MDFKDGASQPQEYVYDANGNLIQDLNKNITLITYNCLNLPSRIEFGDGNSISYVYDADGTKLRITRVLGTDTATTDYCGNVIYENGVATQLLTEFGYITLADNKYHYYLKDHQGNNRVVVDETGNIEEVNDYYPFGGLMSSSSSSNSVQSYKYNGKELDRKGGLDWYDYGARMYDAVLGRWCAVDPMAEKYCTFSPYAYCGDTPVNGMDSDGRDWYRNVENENDFIWRNGNKDINGYTNIGSFVSFQIEENTYLNFYQNAGVKANQAVNAFDLILSSGKLQNQLLGKNSPLSGDSKSALFNSLNSREVDRIIRPFGEAIVEYTAGAFAGGILGKIVGYVGGKIVAKTATSSAGTGINTFFEGARYSPKVLSQMGESGDLFHSFSKSVDGYAAKFGQYTTKVGGDGKVYQWLKMAGSYGGKSGTFEYVKDAKGLINHRFFNVP